MFSFHRTYFSLLLKVANVRQSKLIYSEYIAYASDETRRLPFRPDALALGEHSKTEMSLAKDIVLNEPWVGTPRTCKKTGEIQRPFWCLWRWGSYTIHQPRLSKVCGTVSLSGSHHWTVSSRITNPRPFHFPKGALCWFAASLRSSFPEPLETNYPFYICSFSVPDSSCKWSHTLMSGFFYSV